MRETLDETWIFCPLVKQQMPQILITPQRHSVRFTEQLLNLSKKGDNCLDITLVMTSQPAFPPFGPAPFLLLNDHDCSEQPHCCLSMRHGYLADTAAFSNNQRQKTCRKTNMPLGSSNLSFPEQSK